MKVMWTRKNFNTQKQKPEEPAQHILLTTHSEIHRISATVLRKSSQFKHGKTKNTFLLCINPERIFVI